VDNEARQITSKKLETARIKFYHFMGRKAQQLHWAESHSEVENVMLSLFNISPDELKALEEGRVNPSHRIIDIFKSACGQGLGEHELDQYLKPFLNNSE
jgi:hypothetical protein